MLSEKNKQIAIRYLPIIMKDMNEPIPVRKIGITVFDGPGDSITFPGLHVEPEKEGWKMLIEYAIYMDYDIQHLYDLEHVWIAVGENGEVKDCICSFHGMRIHAAGVPDLYRMEDGKPVLYMQPGKHAFMPDPKLFGLHILKDTCCNIHAGGGLLIPPMLRDKMKTTPERNEKIRAYIRKNFSFEPAWKFIPLKPLKEEDYLSAEELLEEIPQFVEEQLGIIEKES